MAREWGPLVKASTTLSLEDLGAKNVGKNDKRQNTRAVWAVLTLHAAHTPQLNSINSLVISVVNHY
jgi:hypothetical protein